MSKQIETNRAAHRQWPHSVSPRCGPCAVLTSSACYRSRTHSYPHCWPRALHSHHRPHYTLPRRHRRCRCAPQTYVIIGLDRSRYAGPSFPPTVLLLSLSRMSWSWQPAATPADLRMRMVRRVGVCSERQRGTRFLFAMAGERWKVLVWGRKKVEGECYSGSESARSGG